MHFGIERMIRDLLLREDIILLMQLEIFLISEIKKEFEINLITRNKTIYKMIILNQAKNFDLEFRDTYLLLNISLERMGHIFCKKYRKIKFDYSLNTLEVYTTKNKGSNLKKKIRNILFK
jgi:hypothetical protein